VIPGRVNRLVASEVFEVSEAEPSLQPRFFAQSDDKDAEPQRDLVGYADTPPAIRWPGDATVAVQIALNYEAGSELSFAMGDHDNDVLTDMASSQSSGRDLGVESHYEYESRVGIWRLLRVFDEYSVPITLFASAVALERNPRLCSVLSASRHEVAAHGFRWSHHWEMTVDEERQAIARAVELITTKIGRRPVGWYCRRMGVNTRELLVEAGGFQYDADAYNDDLPYWVMVRGQPHLVVPYSMVCNDVRFVVSPGFGSPNDFRDYLCGTLDQLRDESTSGARMMSVGVHPRISGVPGRARAVVEFLRYASGFQDVWFARRTDIATSFTAQVPPPQRIIDLPVTTHRCGYHPTGSGIAAASPNAL
jgi:peptidoglycan/xylan/chitin deacetylase (PgdA/CDA1 family)